jgi:plasmid maintenance system antidote protein VapI
MTMISRRFLVELKLHPEPAYRIAQQAGLNPTTLSKLIHGAEPIRPDDDRIMRVGKILGLESHEVFMNVEVPVA